MTLKILHIAPAELKIRQMLREDVVISGGVIIKSRYGKSGGKIGRAVFLWDEEKIPESDGAFAMMG